MKKQTTSLTHEALLKRAVAFYHKRDFQSAELICQEVLAMQKNDARAMELMAKIAFRYGSFEKGISFQEKCVAKRPKDPNLLGFLGDMYSHVGRYKKAITAFEKIIATSASHKNRALGRLADIYEKLGDRDKARAILQPFVESESESDDMAIVFANLELHEKRPEEAIRVLNRHANNPSDCEVLFSLGKAYEKAGDYDNAFHSYAAAKSIDRPSFDITRHIEHIDNLIEVFCAEKLATIPRARTNSECVVFVVGRHRSGTTLTAKIIGSHPQAFHAGEIPTIREIIRTINVDIGSTLSYPEVVHDLDQQDVDVLSQKYLDVITHVGHGTKRIVDNTLGNLYSLGLIDLLLPKARVINCKRDPVDNCLACFSTNLGSQHAHTYDLGDLGRTYRQYERLMQHWHDVLDIPILDVQYEELVSDPETQIPKIIEFCGLEWDERCLNFHEATKDTRLSKGTPTPSYDQVRKPIYTSSVNRAEKFMNHLGPLIEALNEQSSHSAAAAKSETSNRGT